MIQVHKVRAAILKRKLVDYVRFDSWAAQAVVFVVLAARHLSATARGDLREALRHLGTAWRRVTFRSTSAWCIKRLAALEANEGRAALARAFSEIASEEQEADRRERIIRSVQDGKDLFERRLLILAAPTDSEKGVILVKFNLYFTYFFTLFDSSIFDRYHLVLEPSWVGFFDPQILQFEAFSAPVFVLSIEDRDLQYISERRSNLVPVRLGANYWVNPDIFYELPEVEKEYDVVTVALWADFKRHYVLFDALRRAGHRGLRAACIGMPYPRTKESIIDEARAYGVEGQVDFFECLTQEQINELFNKSRAHMIFSRKEGANKATTEAMFANIPAFVPKGFNYGTAFEHLNPETGGTFDEAELPGLLRRIHEGELKSLNPRRWAVEHISPQASTAKLERIIYGDVKGRLKVKVNSPDLSYLDPEDATELLPAYKELRRYLRPSPATKNREERTVEPK